VTPVEGEARGGDAAERLGGERQGERVPLYGGPFARGGRSQTAMASPPSRADEWGARIPWTRISQAIGPSMVSRSAALAIGHVSPRSALTGGHRV